MAKQAILQVFSLVFYHHLVQIVIKKIRTNNKSDWNICKKKSLDSARRTVDAISNSITP